MKWVYAVLACALAPGIARAAQIAVGQIVQVSRAHPGDAHYEVYAAADPTNASRLLAASFLYPRDGSEGQTIVYGSTDGGRSWTPVLEGKPLENTSDPALAYAPDGTAYYAAALVPAVGARTMLFYQSRDGRSWGKPDILTYMDREYLAVDGARGPTAGRIYLHGNNRIPPGVSDIVLFYSTDQGRRFAGPVRRAGFGKFNATEMGNGVVTSDGSWISVFVQADAAKSSTMYATSWQEGGTLSEAVPISDFVAGGNRKGAHNNVNSLPAVAIDSSAGPFRDRLYVVWPDRRSGHSRIYFSSSADKGRTWSQARVISDNAADDATDQSMPEVAVNREGAVGVMWSDRRNCADNLGWDIRFTASTDGGATFLPSVEISQGGTRFDSRTYWGPIRPATARASAGPKDGKGLAVRLGLSNFLFIGGDTWGLAADAAGTFHPVWSDTHSGAAQLWTAAVNVGAGKAGHATKRANNFVAPPDAGRDASQPIEPSAPPENAADLSDLLTVELTRSTLDRDAGLLGTSIAVVNQSGQKVRGPFAACVTALHSELADVAMQGGSHAGDASCWVFDDTELAPGAASTPRRIGFRLTNVRPFADGDRYRLGLLDMRLRVLGRR